LAAPVTLTVKLSVPYSDVKDAKTAGPGGLTDVVAPVIKLSAVPAGSPVSVVTIPPGTVPGYYNLSTTVG